MDDTLIGKLRNGKTATFIIFQTPEEGIGFPISLAASAKASTSCPDDLGPSPAYQSRAGSHSAAFRQDTGCPALGERSDAFLGRV